MSPPNNDAMEIDDVLEGSAQTTTYIPDTASQLDGATSHVSHDEALSEPRGGILPPNSITFKEYICWACEKIVNSTGIVFEALEEDVPTTDAEALRFEKELSFWLGLVYEWLRRNRPAQWEVTVGARNAIIAERHANFKIQAFQHLSLLIKVLPNGESGQERGKMPQEGPPSEQLQQKQEQIRQEQEGVQQVEGGRNQEAQEQLPKHPKRESSDMIAPEDPDVKRTRKTT